MVNLGTFQNEGGGKERESHRPLFSIPRPSASLQMRQSAVAGEFGVSVPISGCLGAKFHEKAVPSKRAKR